MHEEISKFNGSFYVALLVSPLYKERSQKEENVFIRKSFFALTVLLVQVGVLQPRHPIVQELRFLLGKWESQLPGLPALRTQALAFYILVECPETLATEYFRGRFAKELRCQKWDQGKI